MRAARWRAHHRPECHRIDAAHRFRRGRKGREIGDPGILAVEDPVRYRPKLGEVAACVGFEKPRLERGATNVGPHALVVEHVVGREANAAIQVGGRLVHRDLELLHQVAAVHMFLPEQPDSVLSAKVRRSPGTIRN
jgi:hypothetical protein